MTIQQFIEKAVEGGWWPKFYAADKQTMPISWRIQAVQKIKFIERILLDPLAWQAVGKVEEWKECPAELHPEQCGLNHYTGWLWKMRSMITALAEGKTIEQYLETL